MPDINLDDSTFKHDNPAYKEIASSSNEGAEQLLELVHTQASILHSKEALQSIPEVNEEDYYAGEGGSVDSMSTDAEADNEWLQVPSTFSREDDARELRAKYKAAMEEQEPEDPIQKKVSRYYRNTLKLQKMQNAGLQSTIKSLREELDDTRSKQEAALDVRLPPMTQK